VYPDNCVELARDIEPTFSFILGFCVQIVDNNLIFEVSDLVDAGKYMVVYIETPTRRN